MNLKIPKEVSIRLSASLDSINGKQIPKVKDQAKEIEARRKIFSGEDFKF